MSINPTASRFQQPMSSEELDKRIDATLASNSKKKAHWAINVFKQWHAARNREGLIDGLHVFKTFDDFSKDDLDSQLKYFIFEARKCTGERYPSNSLRDLIQGIGYYVSHILKKDWRIFSDVEFTSTRNALNAAMIEANKLKIEANGNGGASSLTTDQEEKLWSSGVLGTNSPRQLLKTIFFYTGKFFALPLRDRSKETSKCYKEDGHGKQKRFNCFLRGVNR